MVDRQPLLHDRTVVLRAPTQVWCGPDGRIGAAAIDGIYLGDTRFVRELAVEIEGTRSEAIATITDDAATVRIVSLHRDLDGPGADPDVRSALTVAVRPDGVDFALELQSRLVRDIDLTVMLRIRPDVTGMDEIKHGFEPTAEPMVRTDDAGLAWADGERAARLRVEAGDLGPLDDGWQARLPLPVTAGSGRVEWSIELSDQRAVVAAPQGGAPWETPDPARLDPRLAGWMRRSLDDLDALRIVTDRAPQDQTFAAGAPWFFTLFGRDSLWTARLLLPLGAQVAEGTLRTLAAYQGTRIDIETAEEPGKILHELRRASIGLFNEGTSLPPVYYGTVDATPLWICLLADAHQAGLADDVVRSLTPHLRAALGWLRDSGDRDGDGLLEYVDASGRGLANQGWKDSGDSIQWRDGRLAMPPIALCEVQAYAYEAAIRGSDLLDRFGDPGEGDPWRAWAARLRAAFHERYWISDADGGYPAVALDAAKQPVDSLTSNLGHLLGTGLLDPEQEATIARRLVSDELASGFGLRTLSSREAGFWPLAYHGGSVWTHDTAIAVRGLARAGHPAQARQLAEQLLAAAAAFDYRMPELYSGEAGNPTPVPYPAACRPQAWAAAASVAVWEVLSAP